MVSADPCRKITCLNGGNCEVITDDDDVHPECDCAPGYEGEFCEAGNFENLFLLK